MVRSFFIAIILMQAVSVFSQTDTSSKIVNAQFPDSWDKNRNMRKNRGQVLAWRHYKNKDYEYKSCIGFVAGEDSLGKMRYFISEDYTNKKPYNTWSTKYTRIENYFTAPNGMKFGYWDLHLEEFDHKPTAKEIYALLKKWRFGFAEDEPTLIEAGLDDKLWLSEFGFLPDRKRLSAIN